VRVVHAHRIAGIGGSERHLLALLPALRAAGVDARFVGLDAAGADEFYAELARAGVPFRRTRGPLAFVRALRRERPEILHTHLVHADVLGALAALGTGVRLVTTKHNDDRFRTGPFRHVERLVTRRAERVLAISDALARFTVERVGLPAAKVATVRYGFDEPAPAFAPNPPLDLPDDAVVLLGIGRLVPQKGYDVAIRALPAVLEAEPRAALVVAGEGPERGALEALACELGVAGAVHFPGRCGDVAALLRRARLFLHPARWEGLGVVLLEAMLAGVPVVGARASAVPEVLGDAGELVSPDDPAALAAAVSALLADPARAARLGAAGARRARAEFSVERMVAATLAVYRGEHPVGPVVDGVPRGDGLA
jgi:glycosyltransferase involved in cell wall biosynthesis